MDHMDHMKSSLTQSHECFARAHFLSHMHFHHIGVSVEVSSSRILGSKNVTKPRWDYKFYFSTQALTQVTITTQLELSWEGNHVAKRPLSIALHGFILHFNSSVFISTCMLDYICNIWNQRCMRVLDSCCGFSIKAGWATVMVWEVLQLSGAQSDCSQESALYWWCHSQIIIMFL